MNTRFTIRPFLAGILLTVFAFSITPRQVLHDWLANHKDTSHHCDYRGITHFGVNEFHCNCDNLVAESPFTSQPDLFEFHQLPVLAGRAGFIPHLFYREAPGFFSLRGPPVVSSVA